jgi:hypothetical protein
MSGYLAQHEILPLHDIEYLDNLSLNPISAASRAVKAGWAWGNCDDFDFASRGAGRSEIARQLPLSPIFLSTDLALFRWREGIWLRNSELDDQPPYPKTQ